MAATHAGRYYRPGASRGQTARVDLTAVAAFTAAGLSLVNVGLTSRLTRRAELNRWRRDAERPVVVEMLTAAAAVRRILWKLGDVSSELYAAEHDRAAPELQRLSDGHDELSLIAGPALRSAALKLYLGFATYHKEIAAEQRVPTEADRYRLVQLETAMRESARVDLGVAPRVRTAARVRFLAAIHRRLSDAARREDR